MTGEAARPTEGDFRHLTYAHIDGASWITLAEPERGNSLHPGTIAELLSAVRRAARDHAWVIVLAAQGRFFSVGGDLQSFAAASDMGEFVDDLAEGLHRVISELTRSEAVVVSVVQGPAAGAGLSLASAADVVLAADTSSFTLAYSAVGLSNDGGSSLLVNTLGLHRVLRMAMLNDRLTAKEAYDAGLVARIAPVDDLQEVAEAVVAYLLDGPATAYAKTKALIRETAEPSPEGVMRRETLAIRHTANVDGLEGVTAFVEKRKPRFGSQPRQP